MRKRNNFISVFTMFLAIGFAIIFSRPVKATANGVQLKANRTYTAYDVTGDGMKDKIRIRAANQTDDEAYASLTVSVNGKTAYRLKNTRFYNVIATTLIISKKPGNTGISRDIRTEFTTDLLLSD